jgi:hypothetical protein
MNKKEKYFIDEINSRREFRLNITLLFIFFLSLTCLIGFFWGNKGVSGLFMGVGFMVAIMFIGVGDYGE